jgi:hypothetical protein
MTNNNMWDCADMPPMFSAKWNIDDSSDFLIFFFVNFWYLSVIPCEKKYFDSLPLKSMGLYLNLLGHFIAY